MKSMGKLLLVVVPILAITAFVLVQYNLGGIAPEMPTSTTETVLPEVASPRTAQRPPTVLAPQPVSEEPVLPPGHSGNTPPSADTTDQDPEPVIPIPDLQTPTLPPILPPLEQ